MNKAKKVVISAVSVFLIAILLVGCGVGQNTQGSGGNNAAPAGHPLEAMDRVLAQFPQYFEKNEAHVPGTTFNYGMAISSPWAGIIGGAVFSNSVEDSRIQELLGIRSLFASDEFFRFSNEGVATYEFDLDSNTFTMRLAHDLYWHDGVPLTLDDLVFAYEIIAHPDYNGVRFTADMRAVSGIMDYHEGRADHISGLVLSDNNRTLTMHFEEMNPGMMHFGLWTSPTPRHQFAGIAVADMPDSDPVRVNPLGWGPFMVENIVPGESVSMVRNPNFVWGEPQIERLVVQRVTPELAPMAMESGQFDAIAQFPTGFYGDHQNPTNFHYLGVPVGNYTYIAFRLGHWDFDNNVNVYSPDRKMAKAGPLFRQAMAYAVDEGELADIVFHGLQFAPASNVPPHHRALIDTTVPGFPYDPDRARELLDEAGFSEFDSEGFRLSPEGERFTVNWAFAENPFGDTIIPFYIQAWAEVGIRVELWQGQYHSALYLWDVLDFDADDDEIDIYTGNWQPGANPNPSGSWGHAIWNPSRYTSEEYDAILNAMATEAAFDPDYMKQLFSDWQWYWYNNVPYFTNRWMIHLHALNNRVTLWETRPQYSGVANPNSHWHRIGLSSDLPSGR